MIANGAPAGIVPHIREIVHNFMHEYLRQTMVRYGATKYNQIYVVKGDGPLAEAFVRTVKTAAANHAAVDVYLGVHGSAGRIWTERLFGESLNSEEIVRYLGSDPNVRKHLRAVFNSACKSNYAASGIRSISDAFRDSGDFAVTYGHQGNNNAPAHKEMNAFEKYYAGMSFATSLSVGEASLRGYQFAWYAPNQVGLVCQMKGTYSWTVTTSYWGYTTTTTKTANCPVSATSCPTGTYGATTAQTTACQQQCPTFINAYNGCVSNFYATRVQNKSCDPNSNYSSCRYMRGPSAVGHGDFAGVIGGSEFLPATWSYLGAWDVASSLANLKASRYGNLSATITTPVGNYPTPTPTPTSTSSPAGLTSGQKCTSGSQCASGYCKAGPGSSGYYCLSYPTYTCAYPGRPGAGTSSLVYWNSLKYTCLSTGYWKLVTTTVDDGGLK
jgi:hypothetical protein